MNENYKSLEILGNITRHPSDSTWRVPFLFKKRILINNIVERDKNPPFVGVIGEVLFYISW